MSARERQGRKSRVSKPRRKEILVFAEDRHDSDAIKRLTEALNPSLSTRAQLVVQRDPGSLTRGALPDKVKDWMDRVAEVVAVRSAVAEIVCVLVHQDSDAPNADNAAALKTALSKALNEEAHPVVPVQEMESWWFLYPSSFRSVKPVAWRDVKMPTGQTVDLIDSPKEDLMRRTRAAAGKTVYSEADSLAVADKMALAISAGKNPENRSPSWEIFCEMAKSL